MNLAKFRELPMAAITPKGWLRNTLENQRDGLTGHLDEAAGFPFDAGDWMSSSPATVETAFWYDGMIRCGHLLRDGDLIGKTRSQIEHVLAHPTDTGILGPNVPCGGSDLREPHRSFFRAMAADYSATQDGRIVEAMHRHYLATTPEEHCEDQDTGNIEHLCWLYDITGDRRLLDPALQAYELFNRPSVSADDSWAASLEYLLGDDTAERQHGVRFMEAVKLPAILYAHTGDGQFLEAALNGFRKLDRDHMLISGCPSSHEGLAGKNPRDVHETCVVSDFACSAGHMLRITGEAGWADRIERICLNAGMGSVTKDFTALQYYSSPNQVLATSYSSHNLQARVQPRMSYRPDFPTHCCAGNVHRFMPNYTLGMWLGDNGRGLVAALYGPSVVQARVGADGRFVTIEEITDYPFSERVEFSIQADGPVLFPLWLRIPGWCDRTAVAVNGDALAIELRPGSFAKLERVFASGDRVELSLPMRLKMSHWRQPGGDEQEGVGIERGPLVYSLLIEEDRAVDAEASQFGGRFPAWNILPASPWNYALDVDESQLETEVEVIQRLVPTNPWAVGEAPMQLRLPARRVPGWGLDRDRYMPNLPSPVDPAAKAEAITLVPLGSTCIRLTIFPDCRWQWI